MVKPYSPIKAVRNQLIDRRGFIKRVAAAGTGLMIPQMPLIPAWGQLSQGCVVSSDYVTRPPWKVAGVDYCVGIQKGLVLKDIKTLTTEIPGVSAYHKNFTDSTLGQVTVQSTNPGATVTFDGWNIFDTELILENNVNCDTIIFRNCLIAYPVFRNETAGGPGSVGIDFGAAGAKVRRLIVEHCEFGNMQSTSGTINWQSGENYTAATGNNSTFICRWNFFNNCPGDGINQKSGGDTLMAYNVLINQADAGTQGHGDQFTLEQGAGRHFKNTQISFNTIFDDSFFDCGNGTQGFTLQGNDHCEARVITDGGSVDHNTWVNVTTGCPGDVLAGVFYGPCVDISDTSAGKQWVIQNNYVDDKGFTRVGTTNLEWLRVQNFFASPLGGSCFSGDNIDLRTNTKPPRNNRGLQDQTNLASDNQPASC